MQYAEGEFARRLYRCKGVLAVGSVFAQRTVTVMTIGVSWQCRTCCNMKSLSKLLAVPNTLWCYNVFVVPVELIAKVQAIVAAHELCMASIVVEQTAEEAAAVVLNAVVENILRVGSPIEYLLDLHAAG